MERQILDDPSKIEDIFQILKKNFMSLETAKLQFRINALNQLVKGYK